MADALQGRTETASSRRGPDALVALLAALREVADTPRTDLSASVALLREAGLLAATLFPEPFPGEDGAAPGEAHPGGWPLLRQLRALGDADLPLARLYEGHVNALLLVRRFGTAEQQVRAARDARAGHLFGVWNTEGEAPLHLEGPGGQAGGTLRGAKTFASGAGLVTRPLVTAESAGRGRLMLLLRADDPATCVRLDPASWVPLGMQATGSVRADFSGSAVGQDDVIGAPGDYYRQPDFSGGALRFCAAQQGAAARIVREVAAFLGPRLPPGAHDVQALRLAAMLAPLEGAGSALRTAAHLEAQAPQEVFLTHVSLARTLTEDACMNVLDAAERAVGARGLLEPHPFARLMLDLRMYLRQPAPDAARLELGRWLLQHGDLPGVWQQDAG